MKFSIALRKLVIASNHAPLIELIRRALKYEYRKDYWSIAVDNDKLSYLKEDVQTENPYTERRIAKKINGALAEIYEVVKEGEKDLEESQRLVLSLYQLEICGDALKAAIVKSEYKFIIADNTEFKKYYHYSNYARGNGESPLEKSCMRGDSEQEYLDFYKYFPCKLLVMLNRNDKVVARSILWNIGVKQKIQDGNKIMTYYDRIYFMNNTQLAMMEQYCMDKGFLYLDKDTVRFRFHVEMPVDVKYPYLDSFRHAIISIYKDGKYVAISTQPYSEDSLSTGDIIANMDRTNGTANYIKAKCVACTKITDSVYTWQERPFHSACLTTHENGYIPRSVLMPSIHGNNTIIQINE